MDVIVLKWSVCTFRPIFKFYFSFVILCFGAVSLIASFLYKVVVHFWVSKINVEATQWLRGQHLWHLTICILKHQNKMWILSGWLLRLIPTNRLPVYNLNVNLLEFFVMFHVFSCDIELSDSTIYCDLMCKQ